MTSPTYEPADWTPGDVARITVLHTTVVAYLTANRSWRRLDHDESWHESAVQHGVRLIPVDPATTVTLRPDNPDDVKRLADALDSLSTAGAWTASDAVAAMRSLLPPSAPPEPNGLGAVVECRYEHIAGHGIFDGQDWCFRHGHGADHALSPGSLDIVTVVQHGVGCTCSGPGCPGGSATTSTPRWWLTSEATMADDSVGMVSDEAYRTGYADGLAAMREKALLLPDQMAVAWGGDASWLTTGERVASLVLDWLREELQS